MARLRPRFYVQIRFTAERLWHNYESISWLDNALRKASDLACMEANSRRVFPNVRLRYRGLTLARWNNQGRVC